jgi:undecaprenyl diphosphate synthase
MTRTQVLEVIGSDRDERALLDAIDFDRLPRHVAIIMDGNGRWAKSRFLPRLEGHRAGVESVRSTVETAARLGLEALTVYAFSTENWKRPTDEVSGLMGLLKLYIRRELKTLQENNIRFGVVGGLDGLPKDVQDELRRGITETAHLTGLQFSLALNYSGRSELTDVVRRIALEVRAGSLDPSRIDEKRRALPEHRPLERRLAHTDPLGRGRRQVAVRFQGGTRGGPVPPHRGKRTQRNPGMPRVRRGTV